MNKFLILSFLVIAIGIILFQIFPINKEAGNRLTAQQFSQKHAEAPGVVIDVRTREEYDEGHLSTTDFHFDLLNGDFEANVDNLDKEKTYYLYCRSGNRSGKAVRIMRDKGFEKVFNVGGFDSLKAAGFITEK